MKWWIKKWDGGKIGEKRGVHESGICIFGTDCGVPAMGRVVNAV